MPVQNRNTRQKFAIKAAFEHLQRPLSPEEVWREASSHVPSISIATVYRNIHALIGDEWLVAVELPGQTSRYEIAGKRHHHHFHCQSCLRVFDLDGCGVEARHTLPQGFRSKRHELTVYGTCDVCAG